tara:strand:- start:108 stop:809 length:702 start_codon:yes stop_codon:yes gene_type:complete
MTKNILPTPLPSQYELRGESMTCYASDNRGEVNYSFNELGYRSNIEYVIADTYKNKTFAWFGSSIVNGHSIELEESFAQIVTKKLDATCWNFSQGCYRASNEVIVEQVEEVLKTDAQIDTFFIQFIDLHRRATGIDTYYEFDFEDNLKNFKKTFSKLQSLLANKKWYWLLWDRHVHNIQESIVNDPNKIFINFPNQDQTGIAGHFGKKTHATVAKVILQKIKQINEQHQSLTP